MNRYRVLLLLFTASLFSTLGCQLPSTDPIADTGISIHVTVTNTSSLLVGSIKLSWSPTDHILDPDGAKTIAPVTFPYLTTLTGLKPNQHYTVLVTGFDSEGHKIAYGGRLLDTATGAKSFTETMDLMEDMPSTPNETFSDWAEATNLSGGAASASAVELPSDSAWYTTTIPSKGGVIWYKIDATPDSYYSFFWDDEHSGTDTYAGDVGVKFFDGENHVLGYEIGYDSAYTTPILIKATDSTIFIQVTAEFAEGEFALGFEPGVTTGGGPAVIWVTVNNPENLIFSTLHFSYGEYPDNSSNTGYTSPSSFPFDLHLPFLPGYQNGYITLTAREGDTVVGSGSARVDTIAGGQFSVTIDLEPGPISEPE